MFFQSDWEYATSTRSTTLATGRTQPWLTDEQGTPGIKTLFEIRTGTSAPTWPAGPGPPSAAVHALRSALIYGRRGFPVNTKLLIAAALVMFLLTAVSVHSAKDFLAQDSCLDAGGRMTASGRCEGARAGG